jgi:exodeoxyribonuclease VII large subunit
MLPDAQTVVPVSLLVNTARRVIERHLPLMWVGGEVSGFTRAASGHCYFTLKDAQAQVRCTLFRSRAQALDVALRDGLHVEVRAAATIFETRGEFQLNVETVRLAGVGRLYEAFNRMKARLEAMGWFAEERKRALPALPRAVGVVTSPAGAALHDVLTTLDRRFPAIPVVVYPTPVQGAGAADEIAAAIRAAGRRRECDVLVVCRGGGSIEDLWAFNEEAVARAVLESPIPVVSGVGHETDFTICDFVADARAPTPTAAAALAVPEALVLRYQVEALAQRARRDVQRQIERAAQRLDLTARRLRHPAERLRDRRQAVQALARRLAAAAARDRERSGSRFGAAAQRLARLLAQPLPQAVRLERRAHELARAAADRVGALEQRLIRGARSLELLDPRAVLERGYSVVLAADGAIVTTARSLAPGMPITVEFARDRAEATVTRVTATPGEEPRG